ncbi:MAG: DsrE family protein [Pseudomonadota bacterium]
MRFTLLVLGAPDLGGANGHALGFSRALLDAGHELGCVFFQDSGVLTALAGCEAAQAEHDLRSGWQRLGLEKHASLYACSASALRYGLGDGSSSQRLLDGFQVRGLGELVEAQLASDRVLTFAD